MASAVTLVATSGCGKTEYNLATKVANAFSSDQVVVEVFLKRDFSDYYLSEKSREISPDYLVIMNDIYNDSLNVKVTMDNYNGEYEIEVGTGYSGTNPITHIRYVKSGKFINIRELINWMNKYAVLQEPAAKIEELMNGREWIRYDEYTDLDQYEYRKALQLAKDILSDINQCTDRCVTVTENRDKFTFKVDKESKELIATNVRKAINDRNVFRLVNSSLDKYTKSANLTVLQRYFGDTTLTKNEINQMIDEDMDDIKQDWEDNYVDKIDELFHGSNYWDITYTDGTYYKDSSSSSTSVDEKELGRFDIYNYRPSTVKDPIPVYGNEDEKVDLTITIKRLSTQYSKDDDDWEYESFVNSGSVGKIVVTPTGAMSGDKVGEQIKEILDGIDYTNKFDGVELDIDVNGYIPVSRFDERDSGVYSSDRLIPLRKVGEAMGLEVVWDDEKGKPGIVYQTKSGTYIKDCNIEHKLVGGTTYINKKILEDITGCKIFVIQDAVYIDKLYVKPGEVKADA